jgi:hypothetical protein
MILVGLRGSSGSMETERQTQEQKKELLENISAQKQKRKGDKSRLETLRQIMGYDQEISPKNGSMR